MASMTLSGALVRLPSNFYLRCSVEIDPEDDRRFLSAVIMEEPPEDGWTIPTYFDEPPGVKRAHTEEWLEPYRYEDVARIGTTASVDEPEVFEKLLINMIDGWLSRKGVRET